MYEGRRKMKKKTLVTAIVGLMALSLLTGCGSSSDGAWADDATVATQNSKKTETEEQTEEKTEEATEETTEEAEDLDWLGFEEEGLTITPQGDFTFVATYSTGSTVDEETGECIYDITEFDVPASVTIKEVYDEDDWSQFDDFTEYDFYSCDCNPTPPEGSKYVVVDYELDLSNYPEELYGYHAFVDAFDRYTGKTFYTLSYSGSAYYYYGLKSRNDGVQETGSTIAYMVPVDYDGLVIAFGEASEDYYSPDYPLIKDFPYYDEFYNFSANDK
jgi:hypothetical protein